MKLKNKKTQVYLMIILIVAILIGIGYAILTSNLNILGNTTINKASWDIHLENLSVTDGSIAATTPAAIDSNKTTVNFTVKLTQPGDYYEFTVDEVNAGTIDGMISSIVKTGLTENQAKYLDYTVNYSDGTVVSEKQLLSANQTETIKVRVEFKKDLMASDLPTVDTTLDLSFSLNYIQADDSAVAIRQEPVCKRATTLHTETCNQSSNYCAGSGYSVGDTITYGNLGTSGTLTSGDAFDCDVNGDGVYDSETERFYYVSNLDTNSNYAVLLYYNNVSSGEPDNTKAFPYKSYSTPVGTTVPGASAQLPTASQWPNVQGIGELTLSQAGSACSLAIDNRSTAGPNGELDPCQYLMENTKYSSNELINDYWLGSYPSISAIDPYIVYTYYRYILMSSAAGGNRASRGVRPTIKVEKSKIAY